MKKNYYKLFSKRMIISYIISLLLLFVGGWDCLYGISIGGNYSGTFIEIYLISMAHGTASLIAILFPIIGSFPGAGIYREEKDSGFLFYKMIKMNRTAYRIEKLMFTFLSGFLALFLPCLTWLLICFLFLNKGNTTFPLIYGLTFSEKLFNQHPFLYGLVYTVNAGIQGGVFSILTMGISAIIKNRYIAFIIPFAYCIFSASVLEIYCQALNALTLFAIGQYRNDVFGYWGISVYDLGLAFIGVILFLVGDRYATKI